MNSVQSIERAFRILQEIADRPAGISELARRVDLPNTTVTRIVKTLESLDVVVRDVDGTFNLGPVALRIGSRSEQAADVRLLDHARLVALAAQLGEIAGLSVRDGRNVLYVAQADSRHEVQVRDWTGEHVPLHVVSSGLVFLAYAEEADLDDYLAGELQHFSGRTQCDPEQIRQRVRQIRQRGYVWTKEEFRPGINSIAAPIFNADGAIAGALHSHGPSYRFPAAGEDHRVAARIVLGASSLSHSIGWAGTTTDSLAPPA